MVFQMIRDCRVHHVVCIMFILASGMIITNLIYVVKGYKSFEQPPLINNDKESGRIMDKEYVNNNPAVAALELIELPPLKRDYPKKTNSADIHQTNNEERNEWKILAFADLYDVQKLDRFSELRSVLKKHDNISLKATITCHEQNAKISLTLGSDLKLMERQDATVFGITLDTLVKHSAHIRTLRYKYTTQGWILFGYESPLRMATLVEGIGLDDFNVDYIWSYHSSADIYQPFGFVEPRPESGGYNVARKKTKLLSWLVNDCKQSAFWPMRNFIAKLDRLIGVDTFGECGDVRCSSLENCTELMSKYKFNLALEDAECDEYITHKLWLTSLSKNIVPIVYGAPKTDYLRYLPRYSFIHIGDFANVNHLADFIQLLDRNDDLYNKFFGWKTKDQVKSTYPILKSSSFCNVIPTLKRPKSGTKNKKALNSRAWFKSCRNKTNMPPGLI
ncbi:alpha-(1,3)-fucosyltransferase 4-like [Antedon mediterranea]|uniref:alpha-(1,3)-fucosyltransferase 4-like n=1 Tax=Antedon mediterranea TaxID=105859 RepID=UPI003AF599AF